MFVREKPRKSFQCGRALIQHAIDGLLLFYHDATGSCFLNPRLVYALNENGISGLSWILKTEFKIKWRLTNG